MRRVYYAYALSLVTHVAFLYGVLVSVLAYSFTRFVSLPHVFENISQVPVGEVFSYVYDAFVSTEYWTLIILTLFVLVAISLYRRIQNAPHIRMAHS